MYDPVYRIKLQVTRADRTQSGEMMSGLPDFLVIGAMKAGTTSLYHYLNAHPQVYMTKVKELDFFAKELNWNKGFDWYMRQFAGAPEGARRGEASTSYTKFPRHSGVAARIAEYLPHVRLVYVIRNPIERIRSHYQHNLATGEETLPIDEAIRRNANYIDYSRYAMQLDEYLARFDPHQLMVITSEALRANREATFKKVLRFIEVDPEADIHLDREYYRSEERASYRPATVPARLPWRLRTPTGLAPWVDRFRPRSASPKQTAGPGAQHLAATAITEETEAWIASQLRDDVTRLTSLLGDGFDAWGIT